MKRHIITEPDPLLHQTTSPVERFDDELAELIADMRETMLAAKGVGLAAPQIGVMQQLLIVEYESGREDDTPIPFLALLNPRVTWSSPETTEIIEGCLSIPGVEGKVVRPRRVRVKGQLPDGSKTVIKASGLLARVLQHEIDHLNGILYPDRMEPGEKLTKIRAKS